MIMDNVELLDREYGTISNSGCNRIKLRQNSFKSICNAWRKFRLSLLERKLTKMEANAIIDNYSITGAEKKAMKKAKAIARLEEKIMILSREGVPTNYVKGRAIKLAGKMLNNMHLNSINAYTIGLSNYDSVFGDEKSFEPSYDEQVAAAAVDTSSEPGDISRDDIATALSESFERLEQQNRENDVVSGDNIGIDSTEARNVSENIVGDTPNDISNEDITNAISESIARLRREREEKNAKQEDNIVNTVIDESVSNDISNEEISKAISESFARLEREKQAEREQNVNSNVVEAFQNKEESTSLFDVSNLGFDGIVSKVRKIDADGNMKSSYEDSSDNIVRDDVVIVPNREIISPVKDSTLASEKKEESSPSTISDFEALKQELLKVKEAFVSSKDSLANTEERRRKAEEAARVRRLEAEKVKEEYRRQCDLAIEQINALKNAIAKNEAEQRAAEEDYQIKTNFCEEQISEKESYESMIDEIQNMMSDSISTSEEVHGFSK